MPAYKPDLLPETIALLSKDFDLSPQGEPLDENGLAKRLSDLIRDILDRDFGRFLQICYRMDISELRLKSILSQTPPEILAESLAREIVSRQKQKVLIRQKYSD